MNPENSLETLQVEQTGTQTRKFGFRDSSAICWGI